jgi:peptide/nickel transport system permease protein
MSDAVVSAPAAVGALPSGGSPWTLARRRFLRNRIALFMLAVFVAIVVLCLAAPLYAHDVAHTNPFRSNLNGTTVVDGKRVPIIAPSTSGLGIGSTPIGPTWDLRHYFLGADEQGRDVAARMLYGGRNSILIGFLAGLLTCIVGTVIGVVAGFFGGLTDGVISRLLEIIWAFPVYLFAICLSIVLINQDIVLGPVRIGSGSVFLPIVIIGVVYIPYVARPVRGETLSLRRREFVEAAIGLGASRSRLLRKDILPNVVTPPDASWGTIIQDGTGLIYTRPAVALAPGLAIALTVLALNVVGDGIRDALDPRAKVRRIRR